MFLEAGAVRKINVNVVVLKNFADIAVAVTVFYLWGAGLMGGMYAYVVLRPLSCPRW